MLCNYCAIHTITLKHLNEYCLNIFRESLRINYLVIFVVVDSRIHLSRRPCVLGFSFNFVINLCMYIFALSLIFRSI